MIRANKSAAFHICSAFIDWFRIGCAVDYEFIIVGRALREGGRCAQRWFRFLRVPVDMALQRCVIGLKTSVG